MSNATKLQNSEKYVNLCFKGFLKQKSSINERKYNELATTFSKILNTPEDYFN